MTTDEPTPSKPVFQTPNPEDLQSEASQAEVRDRLEVDRAPESNAIEVSDNSDRLDDPATASADEGDLSLRQTEYISRASG